MSTQTVSRTVDSGLPAADGRQSTAVTCRADEIDLLDSFRVIYKRRRMIVFLSLVGMALTVVICLLTPRVYLATASIVPPPDAASQQRALAYQLGGIGSTLLQGILSERDLSDLYVGILESRAVSDALIDRFDLMNVYKRIEFRSDARRRLERSTEIKVGKEGIVRITVQDRDASRSAAMASAYVEELDRQNKRLSGSQATSKRQFLETRLKEIQAELSNIDSLQAREAQIKEMLFELLIKECELAKMEEAKSIPTIQVLDKAIIPEEPVPRGTVKKGVLAGIVAMLLGISIAFAREYAARVGGRAIGE